MDLLRFNAEKKIEIGNDAFSKELQNDPNQLRIEYSRKLHYHDGVDPHEMEEVVLTIDSIIREK